MEEEVGMKGHQLGQKQGTPIGTEEEYVVSRGLRRVHFLPIASHKKQYCNQGRPLRATGVTKPHSHRARLRPLFPASTVDGLQP